MRTWVYQFAGADMLRNLEKLSIKHVDNDHVTVK